MIDNIVTSLDFSPDKGQPSVPENDTVVNPIINDFKPSATFDFRNLTSNQDFSEEYKALAKEKQTGRYYATPSESSRYFQSSWHKKDPIFKDPRYYDNEDLNAQKQGWMSKTLNGSAKMFPAFLSSFIPSFTPGYYDTDTNRRLFSMQGKWEDYFPNYYSAEERNSKNPLKGFLPFTSGFGNFWGDKFVKNLGFMGGAIAAAAIQDAAISFIAGPEASVPLIGLQLGKAASWLEKAFLNVNKIAKAGTLVEEGVMTSRTLGFMKNATQAWDTASAGKKAFTLAKAAAIDFNAASGEASVEGIDGAIGINRDLIADFIDKNNRLPNASEYTEIRKIADASANVRYGLNLVTLAVTNAIQFGGIFSPFKSSVTGMFARDIEGWGSREFIDKAGNIISRAGKDIGWGEKAYMVAKSEASRDFWSEGIQEALQYSFEKATHDYASKKYNHQIRGGLGDYVESQVYGLSRMFDKEGLENFFIGGLTGSMVHVGKAAYGKYTGETKASEDYRKSLIDTYNSFEAKNIISSDKFLEYIKETSERDGIAFDAAVTTHVLASQMANAVKTGNVLAFKALQHDQLFNMIESAVKLNKFEAALEKLNTFKELAPEEFMKLMNVSTDGLTEDEKNDLYGNIDSYVDNIIQKAKHIKNTVELVNNSLTTELNPAKDFLRWTAFQDLKTTMAHGMSYMEDLNSRIPADIQDIIDKYPFMQDLVGDIINIEKINNHFANKENELSSAIDRYNILAKSIQEAKKDSHLFNQEILDKQIKERDLLKTKIKDLREFITETNNRIKVYETVKAAGDESSPKSVAAYKNIISHILENELKNKGYDKPLLKSQVDEIINGLADLNLMNHALSLFLDANKRLQTSEGQKEFLDKYITTYKAHNSAYLKRIREARYSVLKNYKEESIDSLAKQISAIETLISENEADLDAQKTALDELKAINIDTLTPEEKVEHESKIKDLEEKIKVTEENIKEHQKNMEELAQLRADLIEGRDIPTEIKVESPEEEAPVEDVPEVVIVPESIEEPTESLEEVDQAQEEEKIIKEENDIPTATSGATTKGPATIFTDSRDKGEKLAPAYLRFQKILNFFTRPGSETLPEFMLANNIEFILMVPDERFFGENQLFQEEYWNNDPQKRGQVLVAVKKDTTEPIKLFWNGSGYEVNDKGNYFAHTVRDLESRAYLNANPTHIINVQIKRITNGKFKFYAKTASSPLIPGTIFKADGTLSDFIDFEVPGYGPQIQGVEGGVPIMKGFPYLLVKNGSDTFEEGVESIPYLRIPLLAKDLSKTSHMEVITKIIKEFENIINNKSKVNPEDVQKFLESIIYNNSNINVGKGETLSVQMAFQEHGKGKAPFISISRMKNGKVIGQFKIFTSATQEGWKIKNVFLVTKNKKVSGKEVSALNSIDKNSLQEILSGLRTNIAINPVDAIREGKDGLEYLPLKTQDAYLKWWIETAEPSTKIKLMLPDTKDGNPNMVMSPLSRAIEYETLKPGEFDEEVPTISTEVVTPEKQEEETPRPELSLNLIEDTQTLSKKATEKVVITNKGKSIEKQDATVADQQEEIKRKAKELEDIINCIWQK